jgi:hypothetical protein
MSNMEKYYGFKVHALDYLTPDENDLIKLEVVDFLNKNKMDLSDFLVYFHNIIIDPSDEHFGVSGGLSVRVEEISFVFSVNQKQILSGDIRFANYYFKKPEDPIDIGSYSNEMKVGYHVKARYFEKNREFSCILITFVRRDMRRDHQKVTLTVTARPTMQFKKIVSMENLARGTAKPIRYNKPIQLVLPIRNIVVSEEKPSGNIFHFHGPVGAVASTNSGRINQSVSLKISQAVAELKQINDELKDQSIPDTSLISDVEDTILIGEAGDDVGFKASIKNFGGKILGVAENLGLEALKQYIKSQIDT